MINKVVNGYNSLKINAVNILGNGTEGLNDELDFLDDAVVASRIRFVQKMCRNIDSDIKNTNEQNKIDFLINKKHEFMNEMAFLASNGIKNIDFCLSVIDENHSFIKCLQGLKCFNDGDKRKAKSLFDEYFNGNRYLIEHYLISKIYGQLLFENGDFYNSAVFLRKAVEKRPQEVELHKKLKDVYMKLGDELMVESENEIISILEGN